MTQTNKNEVSVIDAKFSFYKHNPFFRIYSGLFSAIKEGIINRNNILEYARELKEISESFYFLFLGMDIIEKSELMRKFDNVVRFSRKLYTLGKMFENEYYMDSELEKELVGFLTLIKEELFYPIVIISTSDFDEEKEELLIILNKHKPSVFDSKSLFDKIESDFNKPKSVKEICLRRNKKISFNQKKNNDIYEKFIEHELKKSEIIYERDISIFEDNEMDFLISDGKNMLVSIEAKTGKSSKKTNELKKLFICNKKLQIRHSYFITNAKLKESELKTCQLSAKQLNINYKQIDNSNILPFMFELKRLIK